MSEFRLPGREEGGTAPREGSKGGRVGIVEFVETGGMVEFVEICGIVEFVVIFGLVEFVEICGIAEFVVICGIAEFVEICGMVETGGTVVLVVLVVPVVGLVPAGLVAMSGKLAGRV